MQGRKRFLISLLCLVVLLAVLPFSAFADETGESVYRVVIDDEADLLTAAEEETLRAVMEKVLPYGNAAFVSVSENPTTPERLAESKFLEFFGDTSGALLIIDMDNRYIQLIADKDVYKVVTGDVLICDNDNVAPYGTNLGIAGKCRYMIIPYASNGVIVFLILFKSMFSNSRILLYRYKSFAIL